MIIDRLVRLKVSMLKVVGFGMVLIVLMVMLLKVVLFMLLKDIDWVVLVKFSVMCC